MRSWRLGRRLSRTRPPHAGSAQRAARAVDALIDACRASDASRVTGLLGADATLIVDGGGAVRAPTVPVRGRMPIAVELLRLSSGDPQPTLTAGDVNGGPGIVIRSRDEVVGVIALDVRGSAVIRLWAVVNPEKLGRWNRR